MSFKFGFYNSVNGDRKYDAEDFGRIFDGIISEGVFATVGKGLVVQAGTGMVVVVGNGTAWYNHTWSWLSSDLPLTVSAAHSAYSRIDAVVLEVNPDTRVNEIKMVEGAPASTAQKPVLENYQHALAYVTVRANTTSILPGDIEVVVGTSETPIVTGALQLVNLDAVINSYVNRWGSEFQEWFTHLQNELNENQAANLQNQIDHIDAFHIGDLLTTKNAHLDDSWLLANGQYVLASDYPDLVEYLEVENHSVNYSTIVRGPGLVMSRNLGGKLVNSAKEDRSGYKHNTIHVFDPTSDPPNVVGYEFQKQLDTEDSHPCFVAYNEWNYKYVAFVSCANDYPTQGIGHFYEITDIMHGDDWRNWTHIARLPFNTDHAELVDGYYDFIWWNGYYYLFFNSYAQGTSTATRTVIRTNDLTDESSWVVVATDVPSDARFSIIDNMLCMLSVSVNRDIATFTLYSLTTPTGTFVSSSVDLQNGTGYGDAVNIVKVDGRYFAEALLKTAYTVAELTITNGVLQAVTSFTGGALSGEIFETDEAYWLCAQSALYYSALYRQLKSEHEHIDLSDTDYWELIVEFDYTSDHSTKRYFLGLIGSDGGDYVAFQNQYILDNVYSNAMRLYILNAVQIPSVPSSVTGFSNYIKAK